jgi:hypothetical protein
VQGERCLPAETGEQVVVGLKEPALDLGPALDDADRVADVLQINDDLRFSFVAERDTDGRDRFGSYPVLRLESEGHPRPLQAKPLLDRRGDVLCKLAWVEGVLKGLTEPRQQVVPGQPPAIHQLGRPPVQSPTHRLEDKDRPDRDQHRDGHLRSAAGDNSQRGS